MRVLLWRLAALLCVVLGFVGVVIPGLPTVPFLLLAAWCGARGWPAMEAWLLAHPRYGETIQHWREHRAVPRRAKWAATLMMLLSSVIIWFGVPSLTLRVLLAMLLLCVALWLWRRPDS